MILREVNNHCHGAMPSCEEFLHKQILCNVIHPLVETKGVLGDAIRPPTCRCERQQYDERPFFLPPDHMVQGYDNALQGNSQMIDAV